MSNFDYSKADLENASAMYEMWKMFRDNNYEQVDQEFEILSDIMSSVLEFIRLIEIKLKSKTNLVAL